MKKLFKKDHRLHFLCIPDDLFALHSLRIVNRDTLLSEILKKENLKPVYDDISQLEDVENYVFVLKSITKKNIDAFFNKEHCHLAIVCDSLKEAQEICRDNNILFETIYVTHIGEDEIANYILTKKIIHNNLSAISYDKVYSIALKLKTYLNHADAKSNFRCWLSYSKESEIIKQHEYKIISLLEQKMFIKALDLALQDDAFARGLMINTDKYCVVKPQQQLDSIDIYRVYQSDPRRFYECHSAIAQRSYLPLPDKEEFVNEVSCVDISELMENSVVRLRYVDKNLTPHQATAFLISENGYALTCQHVVGKGNCSFEAFSTQYNDIQFEGVVDEDTTFDIALIKLKRRNGETFDSFLTIASETFEIKDSEKFCFAGFPAGITIDKPFFTKDCTFNDTDDSFYSAKSTNAQGGDSGSPCVLQDSKLVFGIISQTKIIDNNDRIDYLAKIVSFWECFYQ